MDALEQALKNFEDKSLLFGGKKRLTDILEYLATNKISKDDLTKAVTDALKGFQIPADQLAAAVNAAVAKAVQGLELPAPVFNVTFDPAHFQTQADEKDPKKSVITLKPEVVMSITESSQKIDLIANFIIPEEEGK